MAMVIPLTIPTVTVTLFVLSAVDTAVMFTELPGGSEVGAVKSVAAPEAVWVGLNEPHFAVLQLTVQSTPRFALSFATVAMTCACAPVGIVEGGTWVRDTVMELGGA
jgi:hypothetical protein